MGQKFSVEIIYDKSDRSYDPGQNVSGHVNINLEEEITVTGLKIKCKGIAVVDCTNGNQPTPVGNKGLVNPDSTMGKAYHLYFEDGVYPAGDEKLGIILQKGQTQIPFKFTPPTGLPPSYYGKYGWVGYFIEVLVENSKWETNPKAISHFKINASNVTVEGLPETSKPSEVTVTDDGKATSGGCCSCFRGGTGGPVTAKLMINKHGYITGEIVEFSVEIKNLSKKPTTAAAVSLVENGTFYADGKSRTNSKIISQIRNDKSVAAGATDVWTKCPTQMRIPDLSSITLKQCPILAVDIFLDEAAIVSGAIPIMTGTHDVQVTAAVGSLSNIRQHGSTTLDVIEVPLPQSTEEHKTKKRHKHHKKRKSTIHPRTENAS